MASGHVNRALTGRTHGCSDHCCTREESSCQPGAVHTWPDSAVIGIRRARKLSGISRRPRRWSTTGESDPKLPSTARNKAHVHGQAKHTPLLR